MELWARYSADGSQAVFEILGRLKKNAVDREYFLLAQKYRDIEMALAALSAAQEAEKTAAKMSLFDNCLAAETSAKEPDKQMERVFHEYIAAKKHLASLDARLLANEHQLINKLANIIKGVSVDGITD